MSKVPVSIEGYDVAVLGAGSAGVAAAIAAAKNGAKTILIESSATLGGDLTDAAAQMVNGLSAA